REMKEKGPGSSKKTLTKNQDAPVTKGKLGNGIKRIMSEHLPLFWLKVKKNLGRWKKLGK
ncbi:hypothetical protein Tco_1469487, partial [Tanacetum coccineum]